LASYNPVIKNGASGAIFYLGLPSMASSGSMQANPTLAAGDVRISLDGGALNNLATLPTVTPAAGKLVKVTLSQAETNADNLAIVFSDQTATKEWADTVVSIQTVAQNFDSLPTAASIAAIQADTDNLQTRVPAALVGGKMDANVGAFTAGAITAAAFTAGAIDANAIATDAIGANELAASAVAEIQAGLATSAQVGAIPSAAQNADALLDQANGVESGLTLRQWLRLAAATLFGRASGMATTAAIFRDTPNTKNRVTAIVDADGNRTAVTLDST
jgi:hypothetical protein